MFRSLLILSLVSLAPVASAAPPNVVMLIGDDQAWTDYSFMGHPHIRTPHLDRLAATGLTFRRGYVPSSLCRASLASMVTGLYAHQHKITSNDPPKAAADVMLAQRREMIAYIEKSPTIPRLLGGSGFRSFQAGKWWEGDFSRGGFTHGMTHGDPARGGRHGDVGLKIGRQGVREVLDFIDESVAEKKPFFVWYAPMLPHEPHNPPERLLAKYKDKTDSPFVAKYWAMCEWFDETCGQVLSHLDAKGLTENTLVMYCCDNGWLQKPNAAGFAPRSKRSPYDGGLRTPILVRWPGRTSPRVSEELASTIDLAPTILAAAGVTPPAKLPGVNLLDADAVAKRRTLYGEIFEHNAVDIHQPASSLQYRWVVDGSLKLIVPAKANVPDGEVELFDVIRDPWEKANLAATQPETVKRLTQMLDGWWPGR